MLGSSPLTRGKHFSDAHLTPLTRLIPAHAGKTVCNPEVSQTVWAHPRSRGENPRPEQMQMATKGSSPLTRGKLPGPRDSPSSRGLIPAHAGKTANRAPRYCTVTAHPRSRGENPRPDSIFFSAGGSSPLTRGKLHGRHPVRVRQRLIPAHAGKTASPQVTRTAQAAHPRSRGENQILSLLNEFQVGSSPLTRGKPLPPSGSSSPRRLIPAHAGKTTQCV